MSDKVPSTAELVLHPVRLRILQAIARRELTTAQLKELLPDVTPATLYRHVATLIDAGILTVVAERRVRGAVERTLAAGPRSAHVGPGEAPEVSSERVRQAFAAFVAQIVEEVGAHLDRNDATEDLFGFSVTSLVVDADDLAEIQRELVDLFGRYQEAAAGKRTVTLATVLTPSRGGD